MQKLEVFGANKLKGQIKISGSKNASLPILAATLLSHKKTTLKNLPKQITKTSFGILYFSTVLANTNEIGGIIHSETFLVTKFVGLKFFGATISELTFVKILNSSDTLAS